MLVDLAERQACPIPAATASACARSKASRPRGVSADTGALEAVERILNRGGDADDVLRGVVRSARACPPLRPGSLPRGGRLVLGPEAGDGDGQDARPDHVRGRAGGRARVGTERAAEDRAFLERVAALVSPYCLVGWDTAASLAAGVGASPRSVADPLDRVGFPRPAPIPRDGVIRSTRRAPIEPSPPRDRLAFVPLERGTSIEAVLAGAEAYNSGEAATPRPGSPR